MKKKEKKVIIIVSAIITLLVFIIIATNIFFFILSQSGYVPENIATTSSVLLTRTSRIISTIITLPTTTTSISVGKCYDSDAGIFTFLKGYVTNDGGLTKIWDYCGENNSIHEYSCVLGRITEYTEICRYNCSFGRCIIPATKKTTTTTVIDLNESATTTTTIGKGRCRGEATECRDLLPNLCEMQIGCKITPEFCGGNPQDCIVYLTDTSCKNAGCSWDKNNTLCLGSPKGCKFFYRYETCISHRCIWYDKKCSGRSDDCYKFSNKTGCVNQKKCFWIPTKK